MPTSKAKVQGQRGSSEQFCFFVYLGTLDELLGAGVHLPRPLLPFLLLHAFIVQLQRQGAHQTKTKSAHDLASSPTLNNGNLIVKRDDRETCPFTDFHQDFFLLFFFFFLFQSLKAPNLCFERA